MLARQFETPDLTEAEGSNSPKITEWIIVKQV